jgi:hypothetical protein
MGVKYDVQYTFTYPKAIEIYPGLVGSELDEAADVLQWALDKSLPTADLDVSSRIAAKTAMELLRGCSIVGRSYETKQVDIRGHGVRPDDDETVVGGGDD